MEGDHEKLSFYDRENKKYQLKLSNDEEKEVNIKSNKNNAKNRELVGELLRQVLLFRESCNYIKYYERVFGNRNTKK
jgi:hypothetical protein